MNIAFASSEVAPFSKTGGLADISYSLPKALCQLGNHVVIITPKYKCVDEYFSEQGIKLSAVGTIEVLISNRLEPATLFEYREDELRIIFIGKDRYYDREFLYTTPSGDYEDNAERFIFFSRAVLETLKALNFRPDIIHSNDWQTGLTSAYLKLRYTEIPHFTKTKSVFTIHNIAYHGLFWHWDMHLTGLGWEEFVPDKLEFHGKINLLKAGIVYSDVITTVSKRYAEEIQTPEFGHGLEGVLKARKDVLFGILNGVDYDIWNPEKDRFIAQNYSVKNIKGKEECKAALQRRLGLDEDKNIPLIGTITRLTEQKGIDLIIEAFDDIMKLDTQFVLLGYGDERYSRRLKKLAANYPTKAKIIIDFDEELAHQIEAGIDIYLMPSKYEPCGLNQLYSLKYGSIPVVRNVGGLADSVVDYSPKHLEAGTATGFKFDEYTSQDMYRAVERAVNLYKNDKTAWRQLMKNAMLQDWSWQKAAQEYIKVYRIALKK